MAEAKAGDKQINTRAFSVLHEGSGVRDSEGWGSECGSDILAEMRVKGEAEPRGPGGGVLQQREGKSPAQRCAAAAAFLKHIGGHSSQCWLGVSPACKLCKPRLHVCEPILLPCKLQPSM